MNKARGFGLTAELDKKKADKFSVDDANEVMEWINAVLSTQNKDVSKIVSVTAQSVVMDILKDGVILCHLINVIKPDSVKRINTNKMAFKQMENIGNFLTACETLGCNKTDLFQTVDLYEGSNIPAVITGLYSLGRKAQKTYSGPKLGPEESTLNKREFTEEQLRAGDAIIGLQAGSNKGASQAGQNFGKTRAIID